MEAGWLRRNRIPWGAGLYGMAKICIKVVSVLAAVWPSLGARAHILLAFISLFISLEISVFEMVVVF